MNLENTWQTSQNSQTLNSIFLDYILSHKDTAREVESESDYLTLALNSKKSIVLAFVQQQMCAGEDQETYKNGEGL